MRDVGEERRGIPGQTATQDKVTTDGEGIIDDIFLTLF